MFNDGIEGCLFVLLEVVLVSTGGFMSIAMLFSGVFVVIFSPESDGEAAVGSLEYREV